METLRTAIDIFKRKNKFYMAWTMHSAQSFATVVWKQFEVDDIAKELQRRTELEDLVNKLAHRLSAVKTSHMAMLSNVD